MKPNDIAKVYHDPITGKDLEGEARLLYHHKDLHHKDLDNGLSEWVVEFLSDWGQLYTRTINEANA